ncbi:Lipopolysaccharide export system permease protein lptF [Serratia plymuthica]|nr:Lipopolysaccharide export system permease protein lptF [Serratia plymuthica]
MIWLWVVNAAYFAIALALNLWDTVPMRKLRARLRGAA